MQNLFNMNLRTVNSFQNIVDTLGTERGLKFIGKNNDEATNTLYVFTNSTHANKTHLLKQLKRESWEVKFYTKHLLFIRQNYTFLSLELPEVLEIFQVGDEVYLLLSYYDGDKFNFNTPDLDLAKKMPGIVKDLLLINPEEILEGSSNFDFKAYEERFWIFFEKAIKLGLIHRSKEETIRDIANNLLIQGRNTQKMIISNGDFNPRNIIRLSGGKLVLIDWDGIVSPLEYHLAYPWLLNYRNPSWQKEYAQSFEELLPIKASNVRYHLMTISLQRAVDEKGHNTSDADRMSEDHTKNFYRSLDGFNSLTEF